MSIQDFLLRYDMQKYKKYFYPEKAQLEKMKNLVTTLKNKIEDITPEILTLRSKFLGKNTIQATHIIAEEYVKRFGDMPWDLDCIKSKLSPNRQSTTWQELQRNTEKLGFLYQPYVAAGGVYKFIDPEDEKILDFLDTIIHIIDTLPQEKDYEPHVKKKAPTGQKQIKPVFTECFLCWRSVLINGIRKTPHLCGLHSRETMPQDGIKHLGKAITRSRTPVFRRRKALRKRVMQIHEELLISVPKPFPDSGNADIITASSALLDKYIKQDAILPNVAEHLLESHLPLDSLQDIALALEAPLNVEELSAYDKNAWDHHLQPYSKHEIEQHVIPYSESYREADTPGILILNTATQSAWKFPKEFSATKIVFFSKVFVQLKRAEAWLRAEKEYVHGGARTRHRDVSKN